MANFTQKFKNLEEFMRQEPTLEDSELQPDDVELNRTVSRDNFRLESDMDIMQMSAQRLQLYALRLTHECNTAQRILELKQDHSEQLQRKANESMEQQKQFMEREKVLINIIGSFVEATSAEGSNETTIANEGKIQGSGVTTADNSMKKRSWSNTENLQTGMGVQVSAGGSYRTALYWLRRANHGLSRKLCEENE